jgi:hypothetical protein
MDEQSNLRTKLKLESSPDQRWLLYSNQPEPEPSQRLAFRCSFALKIFRADSTSILLEDLGLTTVSLRTHLKERAKFLRAKDRVERSRNLSYQTDTAEDLDRKMLAVIARADLPELFAILATSLRRYRWRRDSRSYRPNPKVWSDICSNDLEPVFGGSCSTAAWLLRSQPRLHDLLIRILVTDFCRSLVNAPRQLAHFVLPDRSLAANASVFVSRWRSDIAQFSSYNALAQLLRKSLI